MNEICSEVRDELALTGRAPEDERLRQHLDSCTECARFLESFLALEGELSALATKDAPEETVRRLLARPELRAARRSWRRWALPLATAAGLAFLFVAYGLHRPGHGTVSPLDEPNASTPPPAPPPAPPSARERQQELDDRLYQQDEEESVASLPAEPKPKLEGEVGRKALSTERLDRTEEAKKDQDVLGGRLGNMRLLRDENGAAPAKTFHRDPVYPEAAREARVEGTVVLELSVDPEGNVIEVRVVDSIPLLDEAAVEAARQWKYAPAPDTRVFQVEVSFELNDAPDLSLLEERKRVEGLRFRGARGYWENTYVPGDPTLRHLAMRLQSVSASLPHEAARPAALPFDPSSRAALSLYVHADRRGIHEKSRMLVQVGIRARDHHGRRRPPMNVGIVLHLPDGVAASDRRTVRALLESLASARELGDRFRLVASGPGGGEVMEPESFRQGPLTVALQDLFSRPSSRKPELGVEDALALAVERVHAADDPEMPLGTSLVLFVTSETLGAELPMMLRLARRSALGGVSVSAVAIGERPEASELETLALAGQGRRYALGKALEAPSIVERELSAGGRTVARAVRLRIELAEGVRLVDVLGSSPLSERDSDRVRASERSIDLRLARNLGIEADRGEDDDGIQIVIPSFYSGDSHSILLDIVAEGPGPIAEVTARYKDLVQLENTVARASLALTRDEPSAGPLETSVFKDYLGFLVAEELRAAGRSLSQGERNGAQAGLRDLRRKLASLRSLAGDDDLSRDLALLDAYVAHLSRSEPHEWNLLSDSLLYASALKRLSNPLS